MSGAGGGPARESGAEGAAPEGSPEPGESDAEGAAPSRGERRPWEWPWRAVLRAAPAPLGEEERRGTVLLSRGQRERHGAGCVTEAAARGCKRRQVYCAYLISSFCCRREVWKRLESLVTRDTVLERGDESKKATALYQLQRQKLSLSQAMQDSVLNPSAYYAKEN